MCSVLTAKWHSNVPFSSKADSIVGENTSRPSSSMLPGQPGMSPYQSPAYASSTNTQPFMQRSTYSATPQSPYCGTPYVSTIPPPMNNADPVTRAFQSASMGQYELDVLCYGKILHKREWTTPGSPESWFPAFCWDLQSIVYEARCRPQRKHSA